MAAVPLTLYRGTTRKIIVTVRDAKTKNPRDFAEGDKVIMSVKRDLKSTEVIFNKVITSFENNAATIRCIV